MFWTRSRKEHDNLVLMTATSRHNKVSASDRKMAQLMSLPTTAMQLDNDDHENGDAADAVTVTSASTMSHTVVDTASSFALCTDAPHLDGSAGHLKVQRKCWLCKAQYGEVHHHYDQFCPDCARFNYRFVRASVTHVCCEIVAHGFVFMFLLYHMSYVHNIQQATNSCRPEGSSCLGYRWKG